MNILVLVLGMDPFGLLVMFAVFGPIIVVWCYRMAYNAFMGKGIPLTRMRNINGSLAHLIGAIVAMLGIIVLLCTCCAVLIMIAIFLIQY